MLHQDILFFLADLKGNNHKPWFDENRKRYEAIRKQLIESVEELIQEIQLYDSQIADVNPSKTLFRINRDIRFSKDKSPYKINMGAHIASKSGKDVGQVGYYLHIEPESCFLGGGIYMPQPETLKKMREYVAENGSELRKIISAPDFIQNFGELKGEKLKSSPKGYEKDHTFADLLAMKDMYVLHKIADHDLLSEDFIAKAGKIFQALYPLNRFLREAVSE